jgi:hypothetical protein
VSVGQHTPGESIKSFGIKFTGSIPKRSTEEINRGADFPNEGLDSSFFRCCREVERNRYGSDHVLRPPNFFNSRFSFFSSSTLPVESGRETGQYGNKVLHQIRCFVFRPIHFLYSKWTDCFKPRKTRPGESIFVFYNTIVAQYSI